MHVRAFRVHVEDAVVGAVVDHSGARSPFAAPHTAVGRSGTRLGLAPLIGLVGKAIGVADATIDAARFDRAAIGRQVVESRAKAGIDVFLQHIGARIDMRIGVVDAKSFLHSSAP